jgi:deoxyribonuclease-4
MLATGRRLGAHLPLGHGMVRAADRAVEIGATAVQVFTDNPTAWHRRPTLPRDLPAFRDRLTAAGIAPLVVHAPYLINLAGPDPDVFERSVGVLANELRVASAWDATILNVHLGSHRGAGLEAGVRRLTDGLCRVLAEVGAAAPGVTVVLENGTGGGSGIGSSVVELARIETAMVAAGVDPRRFAWCLDVAHLWSAGYAMDRPSGVDTLVAEFDRAIGLGRLRLVHLNDSRCERGSRTDRHEHLGAGLIGAPGLARVLTHPDLGHVAYILETPGMGHGYDLVNLDRAGDLAAGRPLAALPPEAFETPSARGRSAPAEEDDAPAEEGDAPDDDAPDEALADEAPGDEPPEDVAGGGHARTDAPG